MDPRTWARGLFCNLCSLTVCRERDVPLDVSVSESSDPTDPELRFVGRKPRTKHPYTSFLISPACFRCGAKSQQGNDLQEPGLIDNDIIPRPGFRPYKTSWVNARPRVEVFGFLLPLSFADSPFKGSPRTRCVENDPSEPSQILKLEYVIRCLDAMHPPGLARAEVYENSVELLLDFNFLPKAEDGSIPLLKLDDVESSMN